MTNTNKLKGKIAECGYTLTSLSDEMKISRPALRNKINGASDFRVSEIDKLCSVLSIERSEISSYFFA